MKLLVPFKLDEKYRKLGIEILGKENIIWFPETGDAEIILIKDNDFPRDRNFKFIQTISAGTDHIDMNGVPKGAIIASNATAYSISVGEHAFALLLERSKRISVFNDETKRGLYAPKPTKLLYGKTIGIIGYGGIGSRAASIAKSFGMKVIAVGRSYRDGNSDKFLRMDELDVLLQESDFILISIPLTSKTASLIGEVQLKAVKRDCTIINVARPEIVRKEDLLKFLEDNKEASYLTDVWWGEPKLEVSNHENIVITPHVAGGLSGEVMEHAFGQAFENIKRFMEGQEPHNLVNRKESIFVGRQKIGV